ncbi:hypothetical protein SacmaDRAFT_5328 [Saccharomonospora marina XMU15]|uniref:XRE family transcriptional regulator n=2 Tax=Saccharomonospora TaxID=1851 RepID=H5X705_9PSEU|nr:hypothetical protein SacmaDRAFT_5328 [Saccharomonospora marina XMU15]
MWGHSHRKAGHKPFACLLWHQSSGRGAVHQQPRTRLEQLVQGAHLALPEFCRQYRRVAITVGEHADITPRQARRWLSGVASLPRPQARRVLQSWWEEPVEELFGPPLQTNPVRKVYARELLMMTGRESSNHALNAASAIEPAALESLHAEAARLSRVHLSNSPVQQLRELVELRDRVYTQLDRTHKPRQKAELYLIAGQVCGLLSGVAFDLGHGDSAEELARAAFTYGNVIDHGSLCAWARTLTMTVLLWSGRYREVISVADGAEGVAPHGTARARLHAIRARAFAHLGAEREVRDDLAASASELDRAGGDELLDGVGGEMAFDRARRALSASAAFVALRDGTQGEPEANQAIALFADKPAHEQWQAAQWSARADLAALRLFARDLAGAEAALANVTNLPEEHRTNALTQRLLSISHLLSGRDFARAPEAITILEAIDAFTDRALPSTSASLEIPSARELPSA